VSLLSIEVRRQYSFGHDQPDLLSLPESCLLLI